MKQGTILGSQIGRWIVLAALVALLGALLLIIQPVGAQTTTPPDGCVDTGEGADRKGICNFSHVEHATGQVGRLTTREYDQTQVVKIWELVLDDTAFPDNGDFRIDRISGALSFKSPPDYENPRSSIAAGSLADMNVYKVKAKLGDGEKFVYTEVTVRVEGKEEPGTVTLSNRQPEIGVPLTAMLADGDIRGLRTPDWQWQRETGTDTGVFEDIDGAVNATYTPRVEKDDEPGDVGKKLKVIAQYEDSHGTDYAEVTAESEFAARAAPTANVAPEFREAEEGDAAVLLTSRRIEENSASGMRVGPPVFATDNNHLSRGDANDPGGPRDVLTYSLSDGLATTRDGTTLDDGLFSIDQITGQIMTKAALNKEVGLPDRDENADNGVQLRVTAIATDPSGATGQATVAIHVLDVDEAPEVTGPAALTYFENSELSNGDETLILLRDPTRITEEVNGVSVPTYVPEEVGPVNQAVYIATDSDLDDNPILTPTNRDIEWQLTGPDAAKFQFVGSEGTYTNSAEVDEFDDPTVAMATSPALRFRSAPDLENAADVGGTRGDNVYEITVVAWDGDWEIGERDVTIRVADSNDEGMISLSHIKPQADVEFTATAKDPDNISTKITWTWEAPVGTPAAGNVVSTGTTSTYTPVDDDDNGVMLTVTAEYTDGGGRSEMVMAESGAARDNPVMADTPNTDADESGRNTPPKFYEDDIVLTDAAERRAENETTSYVRYVLENHSTHVTKTELEARVDTNDAVAGIQVPNTGRVNVFDGFFRNAAAIANDPPEVTVDTNNLQFDLSGSDAKYFEINQNQTPEDTNNPAGLIKTKRALDFETRRSYTVTVTATDPAGLKDTVTVTINVLDVPEIKGLESRIRVDENTKEIDDLSASYSPNVSLGGLKWALLTTTATNGLETQTDPPHNRNSDDSIDCQADGTNKDLCDNFQFSTFHGENTTLKFAIGTGQKHDAPNFEDPKDVGEGEEAGDNVYKIEVRVAFSNLRSEQPTDSHYAAHPHPRDDEKQDRVVWVRVDDVDEDPKFADDATTRLVAENTDDALPSIEINRSVVGTVTATDPEDTGGADGKKLTYSLSLPQAYSKLFQIVPSTGEILTRSRLNYEALSELEELGPAGGQHRIITGSRVTATDSSMPMGNSDDIDANIRVNDVNETPIPVETLSVSGESAITNYPENGTDAVGTYTAQGENAAMATWALEGADSGDFNISSAGELTFASSPDFEDPADADTDNTYMVTVKASADGEMATLDVTVTVTDVEDEVEPSNVAPIFPTETTTRSIAENTAAGANIGAPVAATDANDDTLTYTLEGTDMASFGIIASTGQLRTSAALDYEDETTYTVVVRATDPGRLYDTITVTINVTNVVNEEVPMEVQDYNRDGESGIQIDELFAAIDDYFDNLIGIDLLFDVIDAYFESA